jgi:hypothetical protein
MPCAFIEPGLTSGSPCEARLINGAKAPFIISQQRSVARSSPGEEE